MLSSFSSRTIYNLSAITRSKDWRFSFVPFIFGCLYLWIFLFKINFSRIAIEILSLSLITSFGFAALGYFINEFFDKAADAKAGKINKLSLLPIYAQFLLFAGILAATFIPWIWLPSDSISGALISCEINLFILYSFPFSRLKTKWWISGIIDSLYAYVIPLLLAYHTYSLFSQQTIGISIYILACAVFLIGFRNITIHHINDIFNDKRAGIITLPRKIGVKSSKQLIKILMISEIALFSFFLISVSFQNSFISFAALGYILFVTFRMSALLTAAQYSEFAISPFRHYTDKIYQVWFPLFTLLLLGISDLLWLFIIPLHFLFLVPNSIKNLLKSYFINSINLFWRNGISIPLSVIVNYSLYFLFRLFGVNLIKENTSAVGYIKKRFC